MDETRFAIAIYDNPRNLESRSGERSMTHERRTEFIALMIHDLFALSDSIRSSVQRLRISLVHKRIASLFHGIEFFAYSNLRGYYSAFLLERRRKEKRVSSCGISLRIDSPESYKDPCSKLISNQIKGPASDFC